VNAKTIASPTDAPFPDMVWIPGGTFEMGSPKHYPEERPVHRVTVHGFWMDRFPVTNRRFARFIEATGHTTFAELPPNPAEYPGALPDMLYAGSMVFVKPSGPVDRRNIRHWCARHLRRCPGVRRVGRQNAADGSRVGVRRSRRSCRCAVRLGRRVHRRRAPHGEYVAGGVPLAEPRDRRLRANLTGRGLPRERLRPSRHDRQRLGVDDRLVRGQALGRTDQHLLRAELLPALPSSGAVSRAVDTSTCHLGFRGIVRVPPTPQP